jgi:hypothetical protein
LYINSPELIEEYIRIFSIHQSTNERNVCAGKKGTLQTLRLRTCYDENLDEGYEELRDEAEMDRDRYLEDSSRYAFDDGTPDHWRQVLRMPGITHLLGIAQNGDKLVYLTCKNESGW